MGLSFRQSEASWSYRGFMSFRRDLANEVGITLWEMEGYGEPYKPWKDVDDNIVLLLNHSDCEGELSPENCLKVAPRLRELVKDWPDDYDREQALILAKDMELCGQRGEALEFC